MSRFWWFVIGHFFSNILSAVIGVPIFFILLDMGVGVGNEGVLLTIGGLALYLFCFINIYPKYFKTKETKMREAQEAVKNGILLLEAGGILTSKIAIDTRQRTFIHGKNVYPLDSIRSWNELTITPKTGPISHYLELHFKDIGYPYVKILMSEMTLKSTMEALRQVINEGKTTV